MPGEGGPGWVRGRIAALRRLLAPRPRDPDGRPLRHARVRRHGGYTALEFVRGQTQSRMCVGEPDRLVVDYTRTMLASLLFRPLPACIGMVGLGGGSQLKFCRRHLPGSRLEVVENNPSVIALREAFTIPPDDARLEIVLDDGARFVRARPGRFDILLVDGYDEAGIPEALATPSFYADCRAALAQGGVMSVNLHRVDPVPHAAALRSAFGPGRVLLLAEPRMSNHVAFAWTGPVPACAPADIERAVEALPPGARAALAPVATRVGAALRSLTG